MRNSGEGRGEGKEEEQSSALPPLAQVILDELRPRFAKSDRRQRAGAKCCSQFNSPV